MLPRPWVVAVVLALSVATAATVSVENHHNRHHVHHHHKQHHKDELPVGVHLETGAGDAPVEFSLLSIDPEDEEDSGGDSNTVSTSDAENPDLTDSLYGTGPMANPFASDADDDSAIPDSAAGDLSHDMDMSEDGECCPHHVVKKCHEQPAPKPRCCAAPAPPVCPAPPPPPEPDTCSSDDKDVESCASHAIAPAPVIIPEVALPNITMPNITEPVIVPIDIPVSNITVIYVNTTIPGDCPECNKTEAIEPAKPEPPKDEEIWVWNTESGAIKAQTTSKLFPDGVGASTPPGGAGGTPAPPPGDSAARQAPPTDEAVKDEETVKDCKDCAAANPTSVKEEEAEVNAKVAEKLKEEEKKEGLKPDPVDDGILANLDSDAPPIPAGADADPKIEAQDKKKEVLESTEETKKEDADEKKAEEVIAFTKKGGLKNELEGMGFKVGEHDFKGKKHGVEIHKAKFAHAVYGFDDQGGVNFMCFLHH